MTLIKTNKDRIEQLRGELADTDYQALKFAEGFISAEDYAEIRAKRQAWRDEINRLQALDPESDFEI